MAENEKIPVMPATPKQTLKQKLKSWLSSRGGMTHGYQSRSRWFESLSWKWRGTRRL